MGAVRNLASKKYYRSDFMNGVDGVIPEEARSTKVRVTKMQRWLLTLCCISLAAVGAGFVQRAHNWNWR
jgi:hypothetical protein